MHYTCIRIFIAGQNFYVIFVGGGGFIWATRLASPCLITPLRPSEESLHLPEYQDPSAVLSIQITADSDHRWFGPGRFGPRYLADLDNVLAVSDHSK